MDTIAVLGVADGVVPTRTSEAGVAWSLASLAPAEVRLESQVYSGSHILQHLGVYLPECGVLFLEGRKGSVEVVQREGSMALLPLVLALGEQMVVEPAALLKHAAQVGGLLASGIEAVEECLTHTYNLAHKFVLCNSEPAEDFHGLLRSGGLIPIAKARGLARCESR